MTQRIFVCGIYRSGTSLMTKLIREWGAYVGDENDLFQGQHGCMEHLALQKLNDELLGNSSRVPMKADTLMEKAQDPLLKERALQILDAMDQETERNGSKAWVWKDPRLPLALPFWVNFWGDVTYAIPVRHPVETILSSAKMEGLEPDQVPLSAGLAYWQFCMLNVLQFTQATSRKIFIAYDQLVQNPERECTRLCQFLDKQQGTTSTAKDRIQNMCSQISFNKWHSQYLQSLAEIETATREQRGLFNFLRVKALYPNESFNPDDFSLYPGWQEYLQILDILVSQMVGKEST